MRRRKPTLRLAPTPGLLGLAVGSIGVVYGDIGTSPLYALSRGLSSRRRRWRPSELTRTTVLGVVSLILWALFTRLSPSKYIVILGLRADKQRRRAATLAFMALASAHLRGTQ